LFLISRAHLGLLLFLTAAMVFLTACVDTTPSWSGLAANAQLAFVAFQQQVHAVDLSNGKPVWDFPPQANSSMGPFYAVPAVGDNIVIVAAEGPAGSNSGILFGLDPAQATAIGGWRWCLVFDAKGDKRQQGQRWNCQLAPGAEDHGFLGFFAAPTDSLDNRLFGGIAIVGDMAYFGMASGRVYAVDITTGAVKARYTDIARAVWATPLVSDDTVYVTSLDHFVYALNRADLTLKWKQDIGASSAGTPALANGTLYIGSFNNKLHALDAATGAEKWSKDTGNWVWGGPIVKDGVLYFTDLSGMVYALDAQSGGQKWSATPGGVIRASPTVISDTVYVGDEAGKLYALNLADGSVRWSQPQTATGKPGQLLAAPLVVNDLVLVSPYQGDNLLVAYTTAGEFKWPYAPSK
jgi:outer membrane protein assembly factor BamB